MSLQTTQDVYRRVINEVVRELKEDPSMKDILTPPVLDYLKKNWLKKLEESGVWTFDNSLSQKYLAYQPPPTNNFFGSNQSTSILDDIFMAPVPHKNFVLMPQSSNNDSEQKKINAELSSKTNKEVSLFEMEAAQSNHHNDITENINHGQLEENGNNHNSLNLQQESSKIEFIEPSFSDLEARRTREERKKSEEMQIMSRKQSDQIEPLKPAASASEQNHINLASFFDEDETEEAKRDDDHVVKHLLEKQNQEKLLAKKHLMEHMKEESDPGEILNSDDDAEELAEIEDEYDSFLDGFFERRTISDTKWKVHLFHGILHFDKKEYILGPIRGDFTFAKRFSVRR